MDNQISIRNLNTYYGTHQSLKNVSVDIPRGQITVILGPSGCGKTTLLRSMNRFLELSDGVSINGQVLIDDQDIYAPDIDVTQLRKRVGLLAQRPYSLPMSIYENVAYGMRLHHICQEKAEMDQRVCHYLKEAGLWEEVKDRLHKPAVRLSLGQQQRLCLARGLAVEPEIILGDEPTSALDPHFSSTY